MGGGAGSAGGETAGAIGSAGAGGGLPQQVAVHTGAQAGLQLAPQGKAERFAEKKEKRNVIRILSLKCLQFK